MHDTYVQYITGSTQQTIVPLDHTDIHAYTYICIYIPVVRYIHIYYICIGGGNHSNPCGDIPYHAG